MKRLVAFVAVVVGVSVPTIGAAQDTTGGIIGGPSLTNIAADSDTFESASETSVGFSIGLQGAYEFHNIVELAPEILFSRRGWKTNGEVSNGDLQAEYKLSYLEVPALVRLAVPVGGVLAPKLMAGPHAGLFIDGIRETEDSGPFLGQGATDIDSGDVKNLQFGLTAAAGVDIELPDAILTTDVRFVRNLTGIFETDDDGEDNVYHQSWQLMVGIML